MTERLNFSSIIDSDAPFASVVLDDRYAFLAGVVAADFTEGRKVLGDVQAETSAVMKVIGDLLEKIGLDFSDIVRVDVHLKDLTDMETMNAAYASFFPADTHPARTCVQSEALFGGSLVEITCVARLRVQTLGTSA